ncbi:MAG: hypothetical protein HOP21_10940 [Methylotenera sp.]|nr:hypothetical protein [Methylotenera sp.]
MNQPLKSILAVFAAGIWINASEFFRNTVLLKTAWDAHYQVLHIPFSSTPVNGLLWMVWGFLFAYAIFVISRKFSLVHTALLSWLMAFVLMWIALFNLSVLPNGLLLFAVPLSLLEAFVAAYICKKLAPV